MVDRDFATAEKISEEFKNPEYKTYFHGCIAASAWRHDDGTSLL